jgi:hypothetical protein
MCKMKPLKAITETCIALVVIGVGVYASAWGAATLIEALQTKYTDDVVLGAIVGAIGVGILLTVCEAISETRPRV